MTSRISHAASLVALGFLLALSACGGGGSNPSIGPGSGSSNSTTLGTAAITSTNAKDVGAQAYFAADSLNSQVSGSADVGLATGVSVTTTPTGLLDAALAQTRFALQHVDSNLAVGVAVSKTVPCPQGGTIVMTGNVASNTATSNGDTVTITGNNCVNGTTTINGAINVTFSNVTGSLAAGGTGTATLAFTFNAFSVTDNGVNTTATGDITMALNQAGSAESFTATGSSLRMRTIKGTSTVDRTLSAFQYAGSVNASKLYTYSSSFTLSGNFAKLGNSTYTVKTTTDFKQQPGSYPSQGVVTVTASDKSSLTLTAVNSTNVILTIDRNGDGTTDETVNTTWTELAGLL